MIIIIISFYCLLETPNSGLTTELQSLWGITLGIFLRSFQNEMNLHNNNINTEWFIVQQFAN